MEWIKNHYKTIFSSLLTLILVCSIVLLIPCQVAYAYETSHSGAFGATRLHYYYYDQSGIKRDKLTSIRGTSFDYTVLSSTVEPDSTVDFDFECGQFTQHLESDVQSYSVMVGRYDAKLEITVLNDTQYEDNGITSFDPEGVYTYELCLWDRYSRTVIIPLYDNSVDGEIVFQDFDRYIVEYDISANLNAKVPTEFDWSSFAAFFRIKYWTSWLTFPDVDINISGTISGSYTLTLDVLVEESINSNLEDINSNIENLQDSLTTPTTDIPVNDSQLTDDADRFNSAVDDYLSVEDSINQSIQGIYDTYENDSGRYGSLLTGLVSNVKDIANSDVFSACWTFVKGYPLIYWLINMAITLCVVGFLLRR